MAKRELEQLSQSHNKEKNRKGNFYSFTYMLKILDLYFGQGF